MAATEPEVLIAQHVDAISAGSRRLYLCFVNIAGPIIYGGVRRNFIAITSATRVMNISTLARPPSWIFPLPVWSYGRTLVHIFPAHCRTNKIWGYPSKFHCNHVCKLRDDYFRISGRHLGFSTSGLVVQYSKCFH